MFYIKRTHSDGTACIVDTSDNSNEDCTREEILNFNNIGIKILGLKIVGGSYGKLYQTMFHIGDKVYGVLTESNIIEQIALKQRATHPSSDLKEVYVRTQVVGKVTLDSKTTQIEVMSTLDIGNGKYLLNFGELYKDSDLNDRVKSSIYLYDKKVNYIKRVISSKNFVNINSTVLPQLVITKSGNVYFGKKELDLVKLQPVFTKN